MAEYFLSIDIRMLLTSFWPFNNVWLGVTAENQEMADKRIPILLQIPAAVRFVSFEPLLGDMHLLNINGALHSWQTDGHGNLGDIDKGKIDWVIIGAESGHKRRECKIEWVRSIVEQCDDTGVPCFVKQLHINGKVSHKMNEWPEDLRVQEYPQL